MSPRLRVCALFALPIVLAACSALMPSTSAPTHADPARLMTDVAWLADDAREGRRAGTESAYKCAEWISQRLKTLGLEAAGTEDFLQEFAVALPARAGVENWAQIGPRRFSGPEQIVPLIYSESGEVSGEFVYCGYGIERAADPEQNQSARDDFAGKELKGRIALVRRGTPEDGSDPKSWGSSADILTKLMNAKRHGAVGAILLCKSRADLPVFDTSHAGRAGIPCVAVSSGSAVVPDAVLSNVHPATIHADVVREAGRAYNVLGLLRGKDHGRTIVVGAHYDHLGKGGEGSLAPNEIGAIHHGADDNASGTATVLEIARLAVRREKPACDVLFALWSGEEEGLLGSEYWAAHPTVPLAQVSANLNLDMVGRAGSGKLQVLGAGTAPPFAALLEAARPESDLELAVSTSGATLGGSSDHQSFLKRQIPALFFFSGLHGDYHKPSDTADKFESGGAAKVATLGIAVLERMAAAPKFEFVDVVPPKGAKPAAPDKNSTRAWFGSVPSMSFEGKGVLLDGTSSGSPAERAGFLKGDVIVQIADVKIDALDDMQYALTHYKPGDTLKVVFERDGKEQETRVTLATRQPSGQ